MIRHFDLAPSRRTVYQTCPCCGMKNALAVTMRDGKSLYHCFYNCPQDSLWRVIRGEQTPTYPHQSKTRQRVNSEFVEAFIQKLWDKSIQAAGSLTEIYLKSRTLTIPIPKTIRHLTNCRHTPSGKDHPAMVAAVTNYAAKVYALHRTYLCSDGSSKANVIPTKMSLGNLAGYGVWLAPMATKMCVAEGIETSLAVQQATGIPTIAALSAGNMTRLVLPPLPIASEVIICADNDANGCGQRAAETAASRFLDEGRRVQIAIPPTPDTDFNDLLRMEYCQ